MKKIIAELRELAKLFLNDEQADRIEELVKLKAWNSLRLYIGDLAESYEIRNLIQEQDAGRLDEWLAVDMMNDIAIELAIQMNEVKNEEKPTRRRRVIRSR